MARRERYASRSLESRPHFFFAKLKSHTLPVLSSA
jgi:hypothetical protein